MLKTDSLDFHSYLPPYRSLINPNARYDYRTHTLIPLTQNDLNLLRIAFQKKKETPPSAFKMKYKSLLSDVSRTITMRLSNSNLLSSSSNNNNNNNTNNNNNNNSVLLSPPPPPPSSSSTLSTPCGNLLNRAGTTSSSISKINNSLQNQIQNQLPLFPAELHIKNLPIEILDYIFYLIDDIMDYKSCMYTCKLFYFLAKPYYYENLVFTSTYRFAQFVTYLRVNSEVGQYVQSIDLSGIKPGYDEDEQEEGQDENVENGEDENGGGIVGGTRDHHYLLGEIVDNPHHEKVDQFPRGKILAGWRDWKFKNNPLYTIHPSPSLTKVASNSQFLNVSSKSSRSNNSKSSLSTTKKFVKPFKYFKSKKRRMSYSGTTKLERKSPRLEQLQLDQNSSNWNKKINLHPLINKFLLHYSTSKDLPIGYILHMINLCPNIVNLNLGNLSLSTDYEISRSTIHKYQNFDLINNYPKDLIYKIDNIMRLNDVDDVYSINGSVLRFDNLNNNNRILFKSNQSIASTASSVYSVTTFSKPIRKYNSLLPPLPQTVADISYLNKGDGKVYLSDLNLKEINSAYLKKINEDEILSAIINVHGKKLIEYDTLLYQIPTPLNVDIAGTLKYINLSSMIWLNRKLIEKFLTRLLTKRSPDLNIYGIYYNDEFSNNDEQDSDDDYDYEDSNSNSNSNSDSDSDSDDEEERQCPIIYKQNLVIDFTDSGMYKSLPWAKKIDLNSFEGCQLANKIINNDLMTPQEQALRRERRRRGAIAANYLA